MEPQAPRARTARDGPGQPRLRLAGLLSAVLLAAMAAPAAAEEQVVLDARVFHTLDVPVARLEAVYEHRPREMTEVGSCDPVPGPEPQRFSRNAQAGWFMFNESQQEQGCGEARFALAVPAGASTVRVSWRADRVIETPAGLAAADHLMEQEFRYWPGTEPAPGTLQHVPYFQPGDAASPEPQSFSHEAIIESAGNITLAWFFKDDGSDGFGGAGSFVGGHSFGARVSDLRAEFRVDALAGLDVQQEPLGLEGNRRLMESRVTVPVPESEAPASTTRVELRVPVRFELHSVQAPDGSAIEVDRLQDSAGEAGTLVLAEPLVATHGPGNYTLRLRSTTPVGVDDVMVPVLLLFLAAPLVSGVFAQRNIHQIGRHAKAIRPRLVLGLRVGALANWVAYWVLLAAVLFAGILPLLVVWPLEPAAGIVYLVIVALTGLFIGVGLFAKRREVFRIQADLTERERIQRELERSNEELERFAYVTSHDLKEPLRMVRSYTELLQKRYGGQMDEDADQFLQYAAGGAERMQQLIDDLLQYSRVGSAPIQAQRFPLKDAVDRACYSLNAQLAEAGAQVEADDLPDVVADRSQLTQLFQNLIGNAVKFRGPDPPRIVVEAQPIKGGWRVQVRDNGIGMDPKDRQRIFDIFQRLHAVDEYPGTGIGLAICKKIVERHGGEIGVDSKPGKGTTFVFTLARPDASA